MSKGKRSSGLGVQCSHKFTNAEGHVERCRAEAACQVCGHCSRISESTEHGHCPGHLGLADHIERAGHTVHGS